MGNGQGSELLHHNEDRPIVWFSEHLLELYTGAIDQDDEYPITGQGWMLPVFEIAHHNQAKIPEDVTYVTGPAKWTKWAHKF